MARGSCYDQGKFGIVGFRYQAAEPKTGQEVPNYRLVNQDGDAIRIHDYKGKSLLLTFIFTRCQDPDQCTVMSGNFATINQELQKLPDFYNRAHLLSISFDPEYDTPKVLRSYGAAYTGKYADETFEHWEFASGSAGRSERDRAVFWTWLLQRRADRQRADDPFTAHRADWTG